MNLLFCEDIPHLSYPFYNKQTDPLQDRVAAFPDQPRPEARRPSDGPAPPDHGQQLPQLPRQTGLPVRPVRREERTPEPVHRDPNHRQVLRGSQPLSVQCPGPDQGPVGCRRQVLRDSETDGPRGELPAHEPVPFADSAGELTEAPGPHAGRNGPRCSKS